mgnify:CR=1 FL=1
MLPQRTNNIPVLSFMLLEAVMSVIHFTKRAESWTRIEVLLDRNGNYPSKKGCRGAYSKRGPRLLMECEVNDPILVKSGIDAS